MNHDPRNYRGKLIMYGETTTEIDGRSDWVASLTAGDTRLAAHRRIAPHKSRLCQVVLDAFTVYRAEGLTTQQAEGVTGLEHSTASARVVELVAAGLLYDSGTRRKTRSGRSAIVYKVR